MVLFSMNSQQLLEVAASDFIAGITVMHHVLTHHIKDLRRVLNNFRRCHNLPPLGP
jgi:hypothetical protein